MNFATPSVSAAIVYWSLAHHPTRWRHGRKWIQAMPPTSRERSKPIIASTIATFTVPSGSASPRLEQIGIEGTVLSARTLSRLGALVLLGLIGIELVFRLALFPGLHGDEAWAGLRALDFGASRTLHGMTDYTGSLFVHLIAAQFFVSGASVFNLRLPGAM